MLLAARKRASVCAAFLLISARAAFSGASAMQSSTSIDPSTTTTTATQQTQPPPPPPPPSYASPGPCGVSAPIRGVVEASNTGDLLKTTLILPTRDNGSWALPPAASALPLVADAASTVAADAAASRCSPPYPLVAFFSGFQARSSSYDTYARHLASWGYAVVRYDARFLSINADRDELRWLADVVRWAVAEAPAGSLRSPSSSTTSSFLAPQPDVLLTAGHSRGAKLAALQFAGSLEARRCGVGDDINAADGETNLPLQPLLVSSAFLIDPVDNTRFTPASPAYPSAAAALRAQGSSAALAIAAAGKVGACNPAESGFAHFWPSVSGGGGPGDSPSLPPPFLLVFRGASHATFNDAGGLGNKLADWLCGPSDSTGPTAATRPSVIADTGAAMVSWFDGVVSAVRAERAAEAARGDGDGGGRVSVSLEAGPDEGVRVFVRDKLRLSASPDALVPSPSEEALQRDFYAWTGAATASGQVEFEARSPLSPATPPAPCAKVSTAAASP